MKCTNLIQTKEKHQQAQGVRTRLQRLIYINKGDDGDRLVLYLVLGYLKEGCDGGKRFLLV